MHPPALRTFRRIVLRRRKLSSTIKRSRRLHDFLHGIERRCVMLRAGSIILTVWGGINFLLSSFCVVSLLLFTNHPLISRIVFSDAELAELSTGAVATIWALALMFNACVAAFSALVIIVVWVSLARGQRWALWGFIAIGAVMTPLVFVAAGTVGKEALPACAAVAAVYWVGIVLSGCGFLRSWKYSELKGLAPDTRSRLLY
jgi:hypothetical protein